MGTTTELGTAAGVLMKLDPVVDALAEERGGVLTDDEKAALDTGRKLLGAAKTVGEITGDETTLAILKVLLLLPFEAIAKLVASWRSIDAKAKQLDLSIGKLGAGVEITGHG